MLKRKKPPSRWLTSSYKYVAYIAVYQLFTHAKMLEDIPKHLVCCNLSAGYFGKLIETHSEILAEQIAAQTGAETVDYAGDALVGAQQGVVVAGGSKYYIVLADVGQSGKAVQNTA